MTRAPSGQPWKPHAYQKRAVRFLLDRGAAALFLDPGLGKTSIVLAAIAELKRRRQLRRVLVIAPLRVAQIVWTSEVAKWREFAGLRVEVLHGKDFASALKRDADLYVINPEGLSKLIPRRRAVNFGGVRPEVDFDGFKRYGFDTLVVDELTRFKHGTTKSFKLLASVAHTFARRWGLTGSPVANGLLDLFAQIYILDGGRSFGRWFSQYRAKYFHAVDPNKWKWIPNNGAAEAIEQRLRPLALRMSARDYLELPEFVETTIEVDLPETARRKYLEVEVDFRTQLKAGRVTASTAAASGAKLRQFASGACYLDERGLDGERRTAKIHDAKLDALRDLVDELAGAPLLVGVEFRHDSERIVSEFAKDLRVAVLDGTVSPTLSAEVVDRWNKNELDLLVAHPRAAGHGINLQTGGAAHVAWFALPWDFELYDQLNRRVWRQGSKARRVVVHRIVARKTVDVVVAATLARKDRTQASLLDALAQHWKKSNDA